MTLSIKKRLSFVVAMIVAVFTILSFSMNSNQYDVDAVRPDQTTKTITITKDWQKDDETVRPDNITIHIERSASILASDLEAKMKSIAGSGGTNSNNTNVYSILKATESQYLSRKPTLNSSNEIQGSGEKVYMWYENNTLYFYSEGSEIYLPQNSGGVFRKFVNLTNIDGLAEFNTSYVTDMNRIFQDSYNLRSLSAISGWDVSSVQNFQFAFGAVSPATEPMKYTSLSPLKEWDVSSVTSFDQAFKGSSYVESIEGLEKWDVSNVTTFNQAFNYLGSKTDLANADEMIGWNVNAVTNFRNMLNNTKSTFTKPIFESRTGTWVSGGTYNASSATPDPSVTPTIPVFPTLSEEFTCSSWTKNGSAWTCEITVPNDDGKYFAWEDPVVNYTSECGGTTCSIDDKAIISKDFTVTNTNKLYKEIEVTKNWVGDSVYHGKRPTDIIARVKKNGTDVKVSENTKWTKNGDTWNYTFVVFDETLGGYSITEDSVAHYDANISALSIDATTGYGAASITNTLITHTLTVTKKITGNLAEIGKTFDYAIDVYDWHNNKVAAFSSSGTWGHNDSYAVAGIPDGFTYEVSEAAAEGYKISYNIIDSDNSSTLVSTTEGLSAALTLDGNQSVTFINNKEKPVETGVFHDNSPFALMIAAVIGGITSMITFHSRRKFKPKIRCG